jgi:aspartate aminotransferase
MAQIEETAPPLLADGPAVTMGPSLIRRVAERAFAHPDALRLDLGEPGMPTPAHVVDAADMAARAGATGYTPNGGIGELRGALASKVGAINGFAVEPTQIVVGAGAVQVLFATLTALVRPGDEVLIPEPSWPDYRMMCELLGVTPDYYPLHERHGYTPDPQDLEARIGQRTRVLIVNNPSNPLGSVHDPDTTLAVLELAARRGVWLISDECYDELSFDGGFRSAGALATADQQRRLVSLFSFSKVHAMTGWRVGYAALPPALATVVQSAQEPLVSCVNAPAQHAALAALRGDQAHVAESRATFRRRVELVCDALERAGLQLHRPRASFYIWVRLGVPDSVAWAIELLDEQGVAVAPGSAFGPSGEGCVRVSVGATEEQLADAVGRMLAKLSADRQ